MAQYDLPDWMAGRPDYGGTLMRGAQVGSQIGHNFVSAMQARHQMAQEDALFPLREQQAKAQMKAAAMDLEVGQHKLRDQLVNKSAFSELSRTAAEISTLGAWAEDKSEARVWEIASRFPSVVNTPEFNRITQQFDLAKAAKIREQEVNNRATKAEGELGIKTQQLGLNAEAMKLKDLQHQETLTSKEKIAKEHDDTLLENTRLKMEADARDVLPQAEYAKFRELVRDIRADPALNRAQKEREMNKTLERLKESLAAGRQEKAIGSSMKMTGPDGKSYMIPAANIEKARAKGFK